MKKHFYIDLQNIVLMPYIKSMVPIYNQWMQDEELLNLTGSDILNLQEEYQNQISWLQDPTKHTFIIIEKNKNYQQEQITDLNQNFDYSIIGNMIGDVNLYFHEWLNEGEAEIEIMIAEKNARRKGYAETILKTIMDFSVQIYQTKIFIAKIKNFNQPSINLFQNKLNYQKFFEIECFQEVHFKYEQFQSSNIKFQEIKIY